MASLKDSLLDGISGKLDKYIIYRVGNDTFIRRRPKKVSNPKSEKQQMQRAKLPGAQTMYKALDGSLLKEICNLAARYNEKRSGYHWFLGKNMNLFGANNYIDYSRLEFSDGSQQLPFGITTKQTRPNVAELYWTDNSSSITAQSTDRLMVAVIFDNEPYTPVLLEDTNTLRKDGYARVSLPEGEWQTAHLYCFFGRDDLKNFSPGIHFQVTKS